MIQKVILESHIAVIICFNLNPLTTEVGDFSLDGVKDPPCKKNNNKNVSWLSNPDKIICYSLDELYGILLSYIKCFIAGFS